VHEVLLLTASASAFLALTAVPYYTTTILTKTIAIDIALKFLVILHVIIVESS